MVRNPIAPLASLGDAVSQRRTHLKAYSHTLSVEQGFVKKPDAGRNG